MSLHRAILLLALVPIAAPAQAPTAMLLKPARVFDGEAIDRKSVV